MLELLNGSHLESDDVVCVFRFLGPLKDNGDMMWVRRTTIQQFSREWNYRSELEVEDWLGHYKITEVSGLNFEWAIDYYDYNLYMYCKANREMTYYVNRPLWAALLNILLPCAVPLFVK